MTSLKSSSAFIHLKLLKISYQSLFLSKHVRYLSYFFPYLICIYFIHTNINKFLSRRDRKLLN